MTVEQTVFAYLREVHADPLRANIVKAKHLSKQTDVNGTKAGMILRAFYEGRLDGVDLSIYNDPSAGQTRYRIESVDDSLTGSIYVDAETCAAIRRKFRTNDYTREVLAEELDVSPTQITNHGRGECSHDVDEPALRSLAHGKDVSWVEEEVA